MKDLVTSLRLVAMSIFACCIAYPAAIWAFGQIISPAEAQGSLIRNSQGHIIGSTLIAQQFTKPEYFWPRPSAANYDATAATGSNLSPASPLIRERAENILGRLNLKNIDVSADMLTASGSGLDPHISLDSAMIQVSRIAQARGLDDRQVENLVKQYVNSESLKCFWSKPIVNVFRLNVALDQLIQDGPQLKKRSN